MERERGEQKRDREKEEGGMRERNGIKVTSLIDVLRLCQNISNPNVR